MKQRKTTSLLRVALLCIATSSLFLLTQCKKDKAPAAIPVLEHNITVVSITGTSSGGFDVTRSGFLNFYDGITYNQAEAKSNSSKVDFAYNYHGGGCSTCRFFENVKNMSSRTGYVDGFSTYTESRMDKIQGYTESSFNKLKTNTDIDKLFKDSAITLAGGQCDITNRTTDIAQAKVFAFIDNKGRKGVFVLSDYVANVPTGDEAKINLKVKVQK